MPSDDDAASSTRTRIDEDASFSGRSVSSSGLWFGGAAVIMLVLAVGWFAWVRNNDTSRPLANASTRAGANGPALVDSSRMVLSATPQVTTPNSSSSPNPPNALPFASEREYWDELERLSAAEPPRALQLALAGERWYSDQGRAAEARRAMIVSLLIDTGKMSEARDWARRFIEQYPESSYRPLVQGKTGIHPRPGRDGRIP